MLAPVLESGYINVYAEDVSEQRRVEQAFRQVQKLDAIGKLTGGVAHDFNNRLTAIIGNLELLMLECNQAPALMRLAREALAAAEGGAQLTRKLLAFARTQPIEEVDTDVAATVEALRPLLTRTLGARVRVCIDVGAEPFVARLDRARLEDSLLNLAINARDAMPDGGSLTIRVSAVVVDAPHMIGHAGLSAGEHVLVTVTDTGVGIAREDRARIFEPFFTTKQGAAGTGLGLSMVYGFVKQSKGVIDVYSEPGRGTSVKLYLPRVNGAARDGSSATDVPALGCPDRFAGWRVLVVEDDESVRETTVRILRELRCEVIAAGDAARALAVLHKRRDFDLLLTDIAMPGAMDGLQLAREATRACPGLRVLLSSGYAEPALLLDDTSNPVEAVDWLAKPYSRTALIEKLDRVFFDAGE
jgi:nitrogen-specific signal transduction histidine kinase